MFVLLISSCVSMIADQFVFPPRRQHDNIRDLYVRFQVAENDEQKLAIVNTLVREIVIHLEAGEITLYKMLREKGMVAEELRLDEGPSCSSSLSF